MATPNQNTAWEQNNPTNIRRESERRGPVKPEPVIEDVKSKKPIQTYTPVVTPEVKTPQIVPYDLEISHYVCLYDKIDKDNGSTVGNDNNGVTKKGFNPGYLHDINGNYTIWKSNINYVLITDIVQYGNYFYECLVSHLSDMFNDDLTSGYWQLKVNNSTNFLPVNRSRYRAGIDWSNIPDWGALNTYFIDDIIYFNGYYKCIIDHTATNNFSNDIASGYWYFLTSDDYQDTKYDGWIPFKSPLWLDGHFKNDAYFASPDTTHNYSLISNQNNINKQLKYIRREEGWISNKPAGIKPNEILPQYNFLYFKAPKTGVYEVNAQIDMEYYDYIASIAPQVWHLIKGVLVMNKIPYGTEFFDFVDPSIKLKTLDDNCPHYFNPLIFEGGEFEDPVNNPTQEHLYCYSILDMKTQNEFDVCHRLTSVGMEPTIYSYLPGHQYFPNDVIFYLGKYYITHDNFIASGWSNDMTAGRWILTTQPTGTLDTFEDYQSNKLFHLGGKTLVYLKQGDVINWFYKLYYTHYFIQLIHDVYNGLLTYSMPTDVYTNESGDLKFINGTEILGVSLLDQKVDIKYIGNDAKELGLIGTLNVPDDKPEIRRRLYRFFSPPNIL